MSDDIRTPIEKYAAAVKDLSSYADVSTISKVLIEQFEVINIMHDMLDTVMVRLAVADQLPQSACVPVADRRFDVVLNVTGPKLKSSESDDDETQRACYRHSNVGLEELITVIDKKFPRLASNLSHLCVDNLLRLHMAFAPACQDHVISGYITRIQ